MKTHLFTFCMTAAISLLLCIGMTGTATAKSLYVIANLNATPTPVNAYDIGADGLLTFQTTYNVPYASGGGVGIAMDDDNKYIFVVYEFSNVIQIVNATTMTGAGTTTMPNASNSAGIVYDHKNKKLYAVERYSNKVFSFDWDAPSKTLTLEGTFYFASGTQAFGLALNEITGYLYVGGNSTTVRYYDVNDSFAEMGSFTVPHNAIGIAVDANQGYVYTGAGLTGDNYLYQYDLNNTMDEVKVGNGYDGVMGISVDCDTGYVYTTTGFSSDEVVVLDNNLGIIQRTGDIGDPTGLIVPCKNISYNPINLTKDDGIGDEECVYASSNIQYTVCYDNGANDYSVEGVTLTDSLPPEVVYVSASGSPYYDSDTHSIVWYVGDLSAEDPGTCETVQVWVVSGTPGETELVNYVGIVGTFPGDRVIPTTQNVTTTVCPNTPPVALCANITVPTDPGVCTANASVDAGSYDPDGEPWVIEELPEGPFELGPTEVLLTITDPFGEVDTCSATVTVEDNTPPIVEMGDMLEMWPPNHKYRSFTLSDCVVSVTDNCSSQSIDPNVAGSIVSIYSDEPEDVGGNGDGKTLDDIVIVNDSEFKLRSERQGKGNGRVYGINFVMADEAGNTTEGTCLIGVPHDQDGQPPINDGPALGYTVP